MEDLLEDIRESFIREAYQFTLYLEHLLEQGFRGIGGWCDSE